MVIYGENALVHQPAGSSRTCPEPLCRPPPSGVPGGRERLEVTYQTVSSVTDPAAEVIGFDRAGGAYSGAGIQLTRGRRRKMTVNGVAAKNGGDLSQVLHTVFFSPEDLFLIREGAAARRRFMDMSLCQTRTAALALKLAEYGRLYEHKTRILRDSDDVLGCWTPAQEFVPAAVPGGQVFITCCEDDRLAVHAQGGKCSMETGRSWLCRIRPFNQTQQIQLQAPNMTKWR